MRLSGWLWGGLLLAHCNTEPNDTNESWSSSAGYPHGGGSGDAGSPASGEGGGNESSVVGVGGNESGAAGPGAAGESSSASEGGAAGESTSASEGGAAGEGGSVAEGASNSGASTGGKSSDTGAGGSAGVGGDGAVPGASGSDSGSPPTGGGEENPGSLVFAEDFEDGDLEGWTEQLGTDGSQAITDIAFEGTQALSQLRSSVSRYLPVTMPTGVSLWAKSGALNVEGTFSLSNGGPNQAQPIVTLSGGTIRLRQPSGDVSISSTIDEWCRLELRNVDWVRRTFDFYVNGTLVKANADIPFQGPFNWMSLSSGNASITPTHWDNIEFYQTTTCLPNRWNCDGEVPRLCNADGSAWQESKPACATNACLLGECTPVLLSEDFEDSDASRWFFVSNGHSRTILDDLGAAGSARSLQVARSGTQAGYPGYDGLVRFVPPSRPRRISFWMRSSSGSIGVAFTAALASGVESFAQVVMVYGQLGLSDGAERITFETNRWYHVELRDINWTRSRFHLYVDDVILESAMWKQAGPSLRLAAIGLAPGSTGQIDQLEFFP